MVKHITGTTNIFVFQLESMKKIIFFILAASFSGKMIAQTSTTMVAPAVSTQLVSKLPALDKSPMGHGLLSCRLSHFKNAEQNFPGSIDESDL
jgi:hypothetical protein